MRKSGAVMPKESRRVEFPVEKVRKDFPGLQQEVYGKPLVYLDNAATTQKPTRVIEALTRFYAEDCSNVHRGVHLLSSRATEQYEAARKKVQGLIGAKSSREIVFVRGATEGINLVAQTFARARLKEGDAVAITELEHHSNIVPWQLLCESLSARLLVIPMTETGEVELGEVERVLQQKPKILSIAHVSNALGTLLPVEKVVRLAHEAEVPVLVDGAQAVPHCRVNVQELDCDFYVFSGHKMYGPTGIGVLYGKEEHLEGMPPYQGGGDMIRSVTFEKTLYNELPYKFEAGTPHIAGAVGLGAAVSYLQSLAIEAVAEYERELLQFAHQRLAAVRGLKIVGSAQQKASVLSFTLEGVHPHDVGTILDREGVAIRSGHHCAQPVMAHFGLAATARASVGMYNTAAEIETLARAIEKAKGVFGV